MIEKIGKEAGHNIDFSQITQERMIDASIKFSMGLKDEMKTLFNDAINEKDKTILKEFNDFYKQVKGIESWNEQHISSAQSGKEYSGTFVGKGPTGFTMQLDNHRIVVGYNNDLGDRTPRPGEKFTFDMQSKEETTTSRKFGSVQKSVSFDKL